MRKLLVGLGALGVLAAPVEAQWRCDDERVVEAAEDAIERFNAGGRLRMVEAGEVGGGYIPEVRVNGLLWDDHKTRESLYRLTYVLGAWRNCVVRPRSYLQDTTSVMIVSQHNGENWAYLYGDLTEDEFALTPAGRQAAGIGEAQAGEALTEPDPDRRR